MGRRVTSKCVAVLALLASGLGQIAAARAETMLTLWSQWADHDSKRAFVSDAIKAFEAANPGVKLKTTWYEKNALYTALKTALRAGQGPDIFALENDQFEYVQNNLLLDLTGGLDWSAIEPWAKKAWTFEGKAYAFPLEAWTLEVYYNKKIMSDLGVSAPPGGQMSYEAFLETVRKSAAERITPISLGVGDRPFPGAFLTQEALLKMLGTEDYGRLLAGQLSWRDTRAVAALMLVKRIIDAGGLPRNFTSLKLGESHAYFYGNPTSALFLSGSYYTSRAFNPPEKGGQPADFPLGIMNYPALPGAACNSCKTLAVGGSYVVNARTRYPDLAVRFLNSMATPAMGEKWVENVLVQTGIKVDPGKIKGRYAGYFRELAAANADATYFIGLPISVLTGARKETFAQVVNLAFPAGLMSVQEVVDRMEAAR